MSDTAFTKRRPGRLSRWVKAALGVVIVAMLAGFVAPHFLPGDRYREPIADLFARQTGHRVSFGQVRVRIFPRVGFVLEAFRMQNPGGFARGEFIVAQQVRCAVAFWPLVLRHRLRLTTVELIRPQVLLLRDKTGHHNYTLSPDPAAGRAGQVQAQDASDGRSPRVSDRTSGSAAFTIDEVVLRDGDISWGSSDGQGHVTRIAQATGVNVDLWHLALAPLDLHEWRAGGRIGGTRITLADWKAPITIRSGQIKVRGGGLEAHFTADCGQAARIVGTLSVADVTHPVAHFDLTTGELNLDVLIADASSVAAPASQRVDGPPAVASSPASEPPGKGLVVQGHLAAGRVRAAGYVGGPATADLRLYPDRLEIWPLTLRFDQGSVQVSARTDRRQIPETFSANVQARNIDVERILRAWPSLRGRLAGTGELDLQIFGSLGTAWMRSLWGKGQFVIRNGRITGANLAAVVLPAAGRSGGGNTTFTTFTTFTAIRGDLAIRDQRVRSRDIHLYGPRRVVDMRGSFDFNGALRYDGQISAQDGDLPASFVHPRDAATGELAAGRRDEKVTVPFSLRGTLRLPELRPGQKRMSFSTAAESGQQGRWNSAPYPNLFGKQ
jgi:AsmA-like C-terminal region